MAPGPGTSVLDLGVTPEASLPESNHFARHYPYRDQVVAASIEDVAPVAAAIPGLTVLHLEGRALPFADDAFDLLFCSAVIEHVGDTDAQRAFVAEALRVSRRFFFTTPNRGFPLDFHTILPVLHWLPRPLHQRALRALGLDFWARTENLNLLTAGALRRLFPPCRRLVVHRIRLLGLTSNLVIRGEK
jgi:SAM-dependent methyltransferase